MVAKLDRISVFVYSVLYKDFESLAPDAADEKRTKG